MLLQQRPYWQTNHNFSSRSFLHSCLVRVLAPSSLQTHCWSWPRSGACHGPKWQPQFFSLHFSFWSCWGEEWVFSLVAVKCCFFLQKGMLSSSKKYIASPHLAFCFPQNTADMKTSSTYTGESQRHFMSPAGQVSFFLLLFVFFFFCESSCEQKTI